TTARAMVQSIDSQLLRTQALARTLATFGGIPKDDLSAFHAWARQVIADTNLGLNVILTQRDGQQVLNTRASLGESLPIHGDPVGIQRVFDSGQSMISELYIGGYTQSLGIHISVPVVEDGQVILVLSVGVLPSDFKDREYKQVFHCRRA